MGFTVAELERELLVDRLQNNNMRLEVEEARGSRRSLAGRLNVSLNQDGTLRPSELNIGFVRDESSIISSAIDGAWLILDGDRSSVYVVDRRVRFNDNDALTGFVQTAVYDAEADETTITFQEAAGVVINAIGFSFNPNTVSKIHHSELADILPAIEGADDTKNKHVSNLQLLNKVPYAQGIRRVADINALRLLTPDLCTVVFIECHTTPGDGGHGTFRWDAASTGTDDGQDIIAVTGIFAGRWKRNIDQIRLDVDELPTPSTVVKRDSTGSASFLPGTDPSHAVVLGQLADAVLNQIASSFDGDLSGTNSGWLKLPGGMIIQWGKNITAATENTWIVHDFPIPFPTKAFVIVGTGTDASVNLDPDIRLAIYGLGQFRIWNTGYTSKYVNWIALGYDRPYAITNLYTWPFDDNADSNIIVCTENANYNMRLHYGQMDSYISTAAAYDPTIGGINLRGIDGERRHVWFHDTTYCPVPDTVGWRVELDFKLNYTMPEYYTDAYNNTYEFFASILAISFNGAAYPWTFDINYSPLQRKFIEGFTGVLSDDTYQLSTLIKYKLMLSRYDGYGIQLELLANGVSVLRHTFLITNVGTGAMRFDIGSRYNDRYFPATITNFRVYEHGQVV